MSEKRRGRPPKYDSQQVLARAGEVFWRKGLAATSLDDLASAMGMNRPSLYNAFGDKEALYRRVMAELDKQIAEELYEVLNAEPDLNKALKAFYRRALAVYQSSGENLGCFAICTATVAAPQCPAIKQDLLELIQRVDQTITRRLQRASAEGELQLLVSEKELAKVFQALLHSLAVRTRAGESPSALKRIYCTAVDALVPTQ
ncbi:TetR/AcrR family transcriptional regulator [Gilvimarinus chinensis]|uniref:TetR/AcrR family transcriptional regulator n=1 Tax=Gilvimarinus chinensis TaxID=396005 RepID=UPI00039D15AD|nr:TetR/AcrR family transcriptional regulator [Gilvimarinus chinensis]